MKKLFGILVIISFFSISAFSQDSEQEFKTDDSIIAADTTISNASYPIDSEDSMVGNAESNEKSGTKLFGIKLINKADFGELVIRFSFNLFFVLLLVWFLYYSKTKRKDFLFTYILISSIIFLLCFLLGSVKIQMGFALGLFAIFGIIRYRTDVMPIKEMTYLFMVIGISVINALANKKISYAELVFTNGILFGVTYFLEKISSLRHESHKIIRYDNIELIKPERRDELILDLEKRIGLKINRIDIGDVNFLSDSAKIQIYYYEQNNDINLLAESRGDFGSDD